jgi:hypothetical protein
LLAGGLAVIPAAEPQSAQLNLLDCGVRHNDGNTSNTYYLSSFRRRAEIQEIEGSRLSPEQK